MKFISKCSNQVLCMKPQRVTVVEGMPISVPGEHIRFENGEFETADDQQIEFIRTHRFFGNQIFEDTKKPAKGSAE